MEKVQSLQSSKQELRERMLEAKDEIDEMFEKGVRPIVTVPRKFENALRQGLRKYASWIPGFSEIVGTFGTDPYLPDKEERLIVRINVDSPDKILPRLTGPDKAFHGVVVLKGPIDPDFLEILDTERLAA